ncbi:amidohydrolase [Planktosalinus lacus]|uniref:Omega-amidase YafV n=1 Tax=Planktosalinus lacus TaxID=1526573 RepID=A0A8J2V7S3_9FLAO|nr:amidohydrolase [Planktosalinus lacus]GGD81642.1 carbon-nitrogen hydrolase [Planktosalinus lacus]
MKETLKLALIQAPLEWENPAANRAYFSGKISSISENVDLVILPEMFTTGFTMNATPNAEPMDGPTVEWMKTLAKEKNIAITGSVIIQENENYFNRMLFVTPEGVIGKYDKRHLFTLAKEEKTYSPGKEKVIIDYKGWNICLMICYDLRFPVWSRNVEGYELILYVANWPKARVNAWDILLQARAVENMAYCAGVNRVGMDGDGYEYVGHSAVYDGLGKLITDSLPEEEEIKIVSIDKEHLEKIRTQLKFLNDKDEFQLL